MSVNQLHKCAARYCPGLPYDPADRAHPLTCAEAPVTDLKAKLRADADRILLWAIEPAPPATANPILDDVRQFIATHPIPMAARPWIEAAVTEAARLAAKHEGDEGDPLPPLLTACVGLGLGAAQPDEPPWHAAKTMRGTRYVGTSGQAEWPPKGNGERRAWPPMGPITDADVEAAEACAARLRPWTTTEGIQSPTELASLTEHVATLTAERDEARADLEAQRKRADSLALAYRSSSFSIRLTVPASCPSTSAISDKGI